MTEIQRIFLVLIILFTISCEQNKDAPDYSLNCTLLKNGIINSDYSVLEIEIYKLTHDLSPLPTANDNLGHLVNFDTLINRINKCEKIHAELSCYGCIETYPVQSEILVRTDSSGTQIQRIIDVRTSEKKHLEFSGIHRTGK